MEDSHEFLSPWAAQRAYLPEESARIHPPVPVKRRRRVLSRDELRALLPALRSSHRPHAGALLLMLLTLTRRQEVLPKLIVGRRICAMVDRFPPSSKAWVVNIQPGLLKRLLESPRQNVMRVGTGRKVAS